jgi:hypothetical protein
VYTHIAQGFEHLGPYFVMATLVFLLVAGLELHDKGDSLQAVPLLSSML